MVLSGSTACVPYILQWAPEQTPAALLEFVMFCLMLSKDAANVWPSHRMLSVCCEACLAHQRIAASSLLSNTFNPPPYPRILPIMCSKVTNAMKPRLMKTTTSGESFNPGVSSVKKLRPPPAPELCRAVDVVDRDVLFRMPAAVGGARADAVPVDVGALGTRVAAWDEDPPFAILLPASPGSCCWSTDSDAVQPS